MFKVVRYSFEWLRPPSIHLQIELSSQQSGEAISVRVRSGRDLGAPLLNVLRTFNGTACFPPRSG